MGRKRGNQTFYGDDKVLMKESGEIDRLNEFERMWDGMEINICKCWLSVGVKESSVSV